MSLTETSVGASGSLGVGEVVVETIKVAGDADPGTEDEGVALFKYAGGVEDRHRIHQGIAGELTYLTRQLSVIYQQARLGIP
jgi:hypothetical protein